jgi:hypothetical protein
MSFELSEMRESTALAVCFEARNESHKLFIKCMLIQYSESDTLEVIAEDTFSEY